MIERAQAAIGRQPPRDKLKLLTIGVPTFNRSELLKQCLINLKPIILEHSSRVCLVISDNSSTDNSTEVVKAFAAELPNEVSLELSVQERNIGPVANIFALIEASNTPYMLFLGDDDQLKEPGFSRLMRELSRSRDMHVVQSFWAWRDSSRLQKHRGLGAGEWSYEIGLAWSSVYNVNAARKALSSNRLRSDLAASIWGQVGLALTSIHKEGLELVPLDVRWGDVFQERPYRYDYENLLTSLEHLLAAIAIADRESVDAGNLMLFARLSNFGFRSHLLGLIVEASRLGRTPSVDNRWKEVDGLLSQPGMLAPRVAAVFTKIICTTFLRKIIWAGRKIRNGLMGTQEA